MSTQIKNGLDNVQWWFLNGSYSFSIIPYLCVDFCVTLFYPFFIIHTLKYMIGIEITDKIACIKIGTRNTILWATRNSQLSMYTVSNVFHGNWLNFRRKCMKICLLPIFKLTSFHFTFNRSLINYHIVLFIQFHRICFFLFTHQFGIITTAFK